MGRKSSRLHHRRASTPLSATLAERTGWTPPKPAPRPAPVSWQPPSNTRAVLAALEALPKLAASIGLLVAAHPDATVEVLPGTPVTIAFTAQGELRGIFVLPLEEDEARTLLALPRISRPDLPSDELWERQRQEDHPLPDAALWAS